MADSYYWRPLLLAKFAILAPDQHVQSVETKAMLSGLVSWGRRAVLEVLAADAQRVLSLGC